MAEFFYSDATTSLGKNLVEVPRRLPSPVFNGVQNTELGGEGLVICHDVR